MKSALCVLSLAGALILTSCVRTTLENRRDLYSPQVVNGPYTRMLKDGSYRTVATKTTTVTTVTSGTASDYKDVVR